MIDFRLRIILLLVLFSLTGVVQAQDSSYPQVFRSVMDGNPRMATVVLDSTLHAAYDASDGYLYKVWGGGVDLDGAVYTTAHGPQPTSTGTTYFVVESEPSWNRVEGGKEVSLSTRYRGHRFAGGGVHFMYDLEGPDGVVLTVTESPEAIHDDDRRLGLRRRFQLNGGDAVAHVITDISAGSLAGSQDYSVGGARFEVVEETDSTVAGKLHIRSDQEAVFTVWLEPLSAKTQQDPEPEEDAGLALIEGSDCSICHSPTEQTVGPSWQAIATRYDTTPDQVQRLATRVIEGGSGEWGEAFMIPHPDLSADDAAVMVKYILSLDESDPGIDAPGAEAQDAADGNDDDVRQVVTIPMTLAGPAIDGNRDESWDDAPALSISRLIGSDTRVPSGAPTTRLLYDSESLYVLFEVPDERIVTDSDDPYNDDAVEVYLDGGLERTEYYQANDVQYIFPISNAGVWINGDSERHAGVEYVAADTDSGYLVEIKIPFGGIDISPVAGLQFGIQFHVDDDDEGGDQVTVSSWSTNQPVSWHDTGVFGTAILGPGTAGVGISSIERAKGVRVRVYDIQKSLHELLRLSPGQLPNADYTVATIDLQDPEDFAGLADEFLVEIDGFLEVAQDGMYAFRLISDDGSRLWLDNRQIINHDGPHGALPKDTTLHLAAGLHSIRLRYFEGSGDQQLSLLWREPDGGGYEVVPATQLSHRSGFAASTASGRKHVIDPVISERPGDTVPVASVHPAFDVTTIRPEGFEPRVGGMDFLSDGRLVLCTWDAEGAVYLVSGVRAGADGPVRVRKIGTGLAEPLGLAVVDDEIFVLQKQELTKLIDLDGDEVIDEYRTIANGWGVTANFHEFAFGLVFRDGYFYGTLATAIEPGGASTSPQNPDRGTVIKIGLDGSHEFVTRGLRTPNGIGIGTDGEMFVTDNEGDWLPSSKLIHVRSGAFYGSRSVDPEGSAMLEEEPPVVWMPQDEIGNSPSQPIRLVQGSYANHTVYGEVTHGGLKRVFIEKVDDRYQGALFRFTQGLEAGINRVVVGPDSSIYVGGIGSAGNWGQTGKKKHGLQRLDYVGDEPFEMLAVRARSNGMEIEFTQPMPAGAGVFSGDYRVIQWRYEPTAEYGGPKIGVDTLEVGGVRVTDGGRRVFLEIDGLKERHVVYIHLNGPFASVDGDLPWTTEAWYTLNNIPQNDHVDVDAAQMNNNTLTQDESEAGFTLLFDGQRATDWTGYGRREMPSRWTVIDGSLHFDPDAVGTGGDIMTVSEYDNFELRLEWKLDEGGNSGIFYRVDDSAGSAWETGPEMQVLDNRNHSDGRNPLTSAGANYALDAPVFDASREAGRWNQVRLLVDGDKVEHWLNGFKVVDYTLWDEAWHQRVQSSKFGDLPVFGLARSGHIVLQDHGDRVWYRNIRIREIE